MAIQMWQKQVALVTGANRGIGQGLVEALIGKGIKRVYLAGRDLQALEARVSELANSTSELIPIKLDVTSMADIEQARQQIPSLDLLFNNAGIANGSGFIAPSSAEIAALEMTTNYLGPLTLTQALLPTLRRSPQAAIVNISSIAGIANMPLLGPYSASKAALHSYTQGLRAELVKTGILVQGVYPGPVDTRLSAGFDAVKPSPREVADTILAAIEAREEDVFPDAMASGWYETFKANPKQLEREYAAWLG